MKKVLVIEDDVSYRSILAESLSLEQIQVISAGNGDEAISALKGNSDISLIVLDLMMPQMDGLTFFYHLKNTLNLKTPVIILSNLSETAVPTDQGILEYLVKANTSLPEVVKKIKNYVESS